MGIEVAISINIPISVCIYIYVCTYYIYTYIIYCIYIHTLYIYIFIYISMNGMDPQQQLGYLRNQQLLSYLPCLGIEVTISPDQTFCQHEWGYKQQLLIGFVKLIWIFGKNSYFFSRSIFEHPMKVAEWCGKSKTVLWRLSNFI